MSIKSFVTKIRKVLKAILSKLQSEKVDKVEIEFMKQALPAAILAITGGKIIVTGDQVEPFSKEIIKGINKINDWDQERLKKLIDKAEKQGG